MPEVLTNEVSESRGSFRRNERLLHTLREKKFFFNLSFGGRHRAIGKEGMVICNVRFQFTHHRVWSRKLLLTLAILIGLLSGPTALAETVYSDTEFNFDSEWSLIGPYFIPADAPNGDFSARQVLKNGNPDAHLQVTMTRPTVDPGESAAVWGVVINDTFEWDPSVQLDGPLSRLDFLLDARAGGAWSLAVQQGEYLCGTHQAQIRCSERLGNLVDRLPGGSRFCFGSRFGIRGSGSTTAS